MTDEQRVIEPPREDMIAATKQHIDFCMKELGAHQFRVTGVPVLSSFAYELVQIMNHEWILQHGGGGTTK